MIWNPEKECLTRREYDEMQLERLKWIVNRAYERVPFYHKRFDEIGLKPEHIKTLKDIEHIPFTTKDDLRDSLLKNGFDPRKKTFFSWLGVSMYLCRDDIEKMLDCIASLSADGSDLVFDYADAGLFLSEVKRVRNMLAMAKAGGEEMKSGFDQMSLELMLADHGFLVYEHLGSHDIQKRYFSERTDGLSAFEHIGYVRACLKRR